MQSAMRCIILCLAALLVGGCGKRQAVAGGEVAPRDVFNDSGGYAGSMADPPATIEQPDVASNIAWGEYTDSRDPMYQNQRRIEETRAQYEQEHPPETPVPSPDTSRDHEWDSVKNPVLALEVENRGIIYLEMWPDLAPQHCQKILEMAEANFYQGIKIHRVEPDFVIQMGDPFTRMLPLTDQSIGSGGPGFTIPAEFSNKPHLRGTLSMARTSDPNSAGSQFFICLERAEHLDNQYTIWGQVLGEGMTVADQIEVGDRINHLRVVHK